MSGALTAMVRRFGHIVSYSLFMNFFLKKKKAPNEDTTVNNNKRSNALHREHNHQEAK
jgi:hypothetical protein